MSDIIELSTGHVFARGSVKAFSPVYRSNGDIYGFTVYGVGFAIEVLGFAQVFETSTQQYSKHWVDYEKTLFANNLLRNEFIEKLIGKP